MPTPFDEVFATDEDLAIRLMADFARLIPPDQREAAGSDGAFPVDRWTLRSATTDFLAQGVGPGHMMVLANPPATGNNPNLTTAAGTDDVLAVASVSALGATLRRKGRLPGLALPPALNTAATGVPFYVPTALPQLTEAARLLRLRYRIASDLALEALADFRAACVAWTGYFLYSNEARKAGAEKDVWAAKAVDLRRDLTEHLAILDRIYGPAEPGRHAVAAPPLVDPLTRLPDGFGGVI